jgi:iodotyrosine deiodinase
MSASDLIPLPSYIEYPEEKMKERSKDFFEDLSRRRTVRDFSKRKISRDVIEHCIKSAGTAPSGANKQPWHFAAVSDPQLKKKIRDAAEEEEREFYSGRAPKEWLDAVAPFGTDEHKPFLESAPYLIAIFAKSYDTHTDGKKAKNYYVQESVGIATGILISAIHNAGLVSLTHTPSPMNFLNQILGRPENERPYLILVVGYPAEDALVPVITKKTIKEIATFL